METQYERFLEMNFVEEWHLITLFSAYTFFILSVVITVIYFIRLSLLRGNSKKYDFINKNEARFFWYSLLFVVIGIGALINSGIELVLATGNLFEFFMGVFMAGIISTILGYAAYAYFKYYYPSIIEKKLNKLRFDPRISPETGKPMKLLTEDEEDEHMTKEMIAEEDEFAFEYDVWLDEETGYKLIEKYDAHLHALLCSNCNFRTLKEYKETILRPATANEDGLLTKFYTCSYCKHKENREVAIASQTELN